MQSIRNLKHQNFPLSTFLGIFLKSKYVNAFLSYLGQSQTNTGCHITLADIIMICCYTLVKY